MNWRTHAYLLSHDLIGSRLRAFYAEFLEMEKWPLDRLEALHTQRLDAVLRHAIEHVPFYRERVITPELAAFPILRKDDVKTHFAALMEPSLLSAVSEGEKPFGYSWAEVRTGGSTGTPTKVIHDRDFRDWGRASRLYSQYLCGFPLGTRYFMLWGSMRDINDTLDSVPRRISHALLRAQPMNAFLMDAERMTRYAQEIQHSSIDHLMAYVDAAFELARFIKNAGLSMRRLKSVMACAGTVTEQHRALLAEVFGARVHNKYGSRECADMACECAVGGFHIYHSGVHLEVVDENDAPVPAGQTGRILVTLLHNRRFPLIRYEIGDIGSLGARRCDCGSPLPLLDRVEGRISERITAVNGAYVSPVFIRHVIGTPYTQGAIERFQFRQTGAGEYVLALRFDARVADSERQAMIAGMRSALIKVLGRAARIEFITTDPLISPESGKFQFFQNLRRS